MPVGTDRNIAISYDDRRRGRYAGADTPKKIFPEDIGFPAFLTEQVLTDKM